MSDRKYVRFSDCAGKRIERVHPTCEGFLIVFEGREYSFLEARRLYDDADIEELEFVPSEHGEDVAIRSGLWSELEIEEAKEARRLAYAERERARLREHYEKLKKIFGDI